MASCHPDRHALARSLCASCYKGRKKRGEQMPPRVRRLHQLPGSNRNRKSGEDLMAYVERRVIRQPNGCWEWPLKLRKYPRIKCDGVGRQLTHLVLERKLGRPIADGMIALHSCDNRVCVNPDHLREGTYADNTADMFERGRFVLGARPPRPLKLDEQQVREIKAARIIKRSATDGVNALAARHGITIGMVWKIRHGKAWAHVA